jgi:ribosomal protein L15
MPDHFEGGQNPIQRRIPKRGFVNIHRVEIHGVNVGRLEAPSRRARKSRSTACTPGTSCPSEPS